MGSLSRVSARRAGGIPDFMVHTNRVVRLIFRAPVKLYEHGLGWLLGSRFLCLTQLIDSLPGCPGGTLRKC